jgi:hypothetical protein
LTRQHVSLLWRTVCSKLHLSKKEKK